MKRKKGPCSVSFLLILDRRTPPDSVSQLNSDTVFRLEKEPVIHLACAWMIDLPETQES